MHVGMERNPYSISLCVRLYLWTCTCSLASQTYIELQLDWDRGTSSGVEPNFWLTIKIIHCVMSGDNAMIEMARNSISEATIDYSFTDRSFRLTRHFNLSIVT